MRKAAGGSGTYEQGSDHLDCHWGVRAVYAGHWRVVFPQGHRHGRLYRGRPQRRGVDFRPLLRHGLFLRGDVHRLLRGLWVELRPVERAGGRGQRGVRHAAGLAGAGGPHPGPDPGAPHQVHAPAVFPAVPKPWDGPFLLRGDLPVPHPLLRLGVQGPDQRVLGDFGH